MDKWVESASPGFKVAMGVLGAVCVVLQLLGYNLRRPLAWLFWSTWIGYPALLTVAGALALLLGSCDQTPVWAWLWGPLSTGAIAVAIVHSGMRWSPGVHVWAYLAAPVLAAWLLCFEAVRLRAWSWARMLGVLLVCAVFLPGFLLTAVGAYRPVNTQLYLDPGPHPHSTTTTALASPAVTPRFPLVDQHCVGGFGPDEAEPPDVPEQVWLAILEVGRAESAWDLCRTGDVTLDPDGLYDQKVDSRQSGPEGHIIVQFDGPDAVPVFIPPIVGELYYAQPGGEPPSWGFPTDPKPCEQGYMISIFHNLDGTVAGYALWSQDPTPQTLAGMSAWFVPADVAANLLARLTPDTPLPLAYGPPVPAPDGLRTQFFRSVVVTTTRRTLPPVDDARLLDHC